MGFAFLSCSTTALVRRRTWLFLCHSWLWLFAVCARTALASGEVRDWLGGSLQNVLKVLRKAPGVCTRAQKCKSGKASGL